MRRLGFNLLIPSRLRAAERPDLVVGFDLDGFLVPGRTGLPFVLNLKGVALDEARFERGPARVGRIVAARLEGRAAREACRVVVPSRYSAERAVRSYGLDPGRVRVVPEGIDPGRWERAGSAARAPEPTVLTVARQYRRKNVAALLRALPRVREAVAGVRLRVVGTGPELPRLRKLARDLGVSGQVAFLGALSDEDLEEEYGRAHCFCLPSRQEGFGIVFLEAMASGLPVVAARAGAVPEVVPHDRAGFLVDPDDTGALASALTRILSNPGLAWELGAAGRERARSFSLRRAGESFLEAVEPCLRSGARPS